MKIRGENEDLKLERERNARSSQTNRRV